MIPIEIEDIDKFQKEQIKTIGHYIYYRGGSVEGVFMRAFYDINGKCKRVDEITYEQYLSDPRKDPYVFRGVWSHETL